MKPPATRLHTAATYFPLTPEHSFFLLASWWEVSSDNASRSQEESLPSNTRLR